MRFDFDTLYRYVGTICVHATWLEQELEDTIIELTGSDNVAVIVRGQRGSNSVSAIKRLLAEGVVADDDAVRIKALVVRASKALDERDKIVHTVWAKTNDTEPGFIKGTITRASGSSTQQWSFAMLEEVRTNLEHLQIDLGIATHNAVASQRGYGLIPPIER